MTKNTTVTEAVCGGELDFMSAIEAHVRWKVRLEAYIAGTGEESLDADQVCRDDLCLLGKWIYGHGGATYGSHPKFSSLKEIHGEFHRCAGDVIRAVDRGQPEQARDMLCKGEYAKYSHRVKAELARLGLELEKWCDD